MTSTTHTPLLAAFCEPVVTFVVPNENYALRYDLECLDRLRPLGFVEPVVLFCSRILEQKRNIKVSCLQAREILTKLGRNPDEHSFPRK